MLAALFSSTASPTSTRGLDLAIRLAKPTVLSASGSSDVLDRFVLDGHGDHTADVFGMLREAGEEILQQMRARVAASGVDVTTWIFDPSRAGSVMSSTVRRR
jgi:hypothetical protein